MLFTAFSTPIERARIEVLSLKTGKRTVLLEGGVSARYVTAGYLVYAKNEALYAAPFDLKQLKVTGQPVPVVQDVALTTDDGRAGFSVSDNGTLAYIAASTFVPDLDLVWVNRRGEAGASITAPARFGEPAIAPDGHSIAISIAKPGEPKDVWVLDLARGTRTALTNGGANDFGPLFTLDGNRVIYQSERPVFDLYVRAADASSPATPLLVTPYDKYPGSITPDGKTLLFRYSLVPHAEIWTLPLDGTGKPTALLRSESGDLSTPRIAPNGRWLAYTSNESGRSRGLPESVPRGDQRPPPGIGRWRFQRPLDQGGARADLPQRPANDGRLRRSRLGATRDAGRAVPRRFRDRWLPQQL